MNLFDKLENAPVGTLKNVTQETFVDTTGEVSEIEALAGGKAAEINTGPQASTNAAPQPESASQSPKQSLGHLLNAKTCIGIVDSILPALAVICFQYFLNVRIPKREVQLNEGERAIIQIPLQNYLNSVTIDFDSPLMALVVTLAAVYGSKFAEKGFTSYFDKRDADNLHKEEMEKLKKGLKTEIVKVAPVVELVDLKAGEINKPPVTEDTNEYGYTKEQMRVARQALIKSGKKSPSNSTCAAYLRRQEQK